MSQLPPKIANYSKAWTIESFREELAKTPRPKWCKGVTIHHTGTPSLAMRREGLTPQHMINLAHYYGVEQGWAGAPHLFVDDSEAPLKGMNLLNQTGVHAKSFNNTHFGIEVLGDYDLESPLEGRGLECWHRAAWATHDILKWLGLPIAKSSINFHRDDPKTNKTCPGLRVTKEWFIFKVSACSENPAYGPLETEEFYPITVLGKPFVSPSFQIAGKVLVPARAFVEAVGGDASQLVWNKKELFYGGINLEGELIKDGTGYVQLRHLAATLGFRTEFSDGVIQVVRK